MFENDVGGGMWYEEEGEEYYSDSKIFFIRVNYMWGVINVIINVCYNFNYYYYFIKEKIEKWRV